MTSHGQASRWQQHRALQVHNIVISTSLGSLSFSVTHTHTHTHTLCSSNRIGRDRELIWAGLNPEQSEWWLPRHLALARIHLTYQYNIPALNFILSYAWWSRLLEWWLEPTNSDYIVWVEPRKGYIKYDPCRKVNVSLILRTLANLFIHHLLV